jgi:hypothetical protein
LPSFPYLDLAITFDLLSGAVALLVSYYAFRYNRLIENSTLKFISFGFMILGLGLLTSGAVDALVIFGVGDFYTDRVLVIGASSLYHVLEIAAYFTFAVGYVRAAYSLPASPAVRGEEESTLDVSPKTQSKMALIFTIPCVLAAAANAGIRRLQEMMAFVKAESLVTEILIVVFLSMVVFQGLISHAQARNRLSLFVLLSFSLILAAHILFLGSAAFSSVLTSIVAAGIQFAGFLSLLVFLAWRGRFGSPAGKAAQ